VRGRALKVVMAVAVMAAAAFLAAAASGRSSAAGTLVFGTTADPVVLDGALISDGESGRVVIQIYEGLVDLKPGTTIVVPKLATSWSASKNGLTWTFQLRQGVKFTDNTPFNAKAVCYNFNRWYNFTGSFQNPGATYYWQTVFGGFAHNEPGSPTSSLYKGCKTVGQYTVKLLLTARSSSFLSALSAASFRMESPTAMKKYGADQGTVDSNGVFHPTGSYATQHPTGTGPFMLKSWKVGDKLELVPNPKYWGPKPKYGKIVIRNVEASVQKLDVLKGESQIAVDLSPTQAQGMTGVQIVNGASPNLFFLLTNDNPKISKITSNPQFQTAVRDGIDYAGLVQLAGKGAVQAAGIIPSMFLGSLPAGSGATFDATKAKAALAASGAGHPTLKLVYPSDIQVNGISFGDLAARVQQDLQAIGITVQLQGQSIQVALNSYRGGQEAMGLWYWGPDFPDPSDYLNFLPGALVGLRAGWAKGADPALEKMGATAAGTTQNAARGVIYQQIQRSMNSASPFMPLIQPAQILVGAQSLKNLQSNALWLVDLSELG